MAPRKMLCFLRGKQWEKIFAPVAQLVERELGKFEVSGSIPDGGSGLRNSYELTVESYE